MNTHRIRIGLAALGVAALTSVSAVGGATARAEQASPQKNIVQTASDAGQFNTLLRLAKRAGLAGAFSGSGPLTVFAPTDRAFARVPQRTLRALERNPRQLRSVLLYHAVRGNVRAAQVVRLRRAKTLNGASVRIGVRGSRVYLNRTSRVVRTDIEASNGTIHVINNVLIPPTR